MYGERFHKIAFGRTVKKVRFQDTQPLRTKTVPMAKTTLTPSDGDGQVEFSRIVKMTGLNQEPQSYSARANPAECEALMGRLDLIGLSDFTVEADVKKWRKGVRVTGTIKASVIQRCIVTLDPVPDQISETFDRGFLPERDLVGETKPGQEVEIEDDAELGDLPDILGDTLDLGEIASEALSLALNPYPRAEGEEPLDLQAAPPGERPMSDNDVKPFASLAAYREKLEKQGKDD